MSPMFIFFKQRDPFNLKLIRLDRTFSRRTPVKPPMTWCKRDIFCDLWALIFFLEKLTILATLIPFIGMHRVPPRQILINKPYCVSGPSFSVMISIISL